MLKEKEAVSSESTGQSILSALPVLLLIVLEVVHVAASVVVGRVVSFALVRSRH